MGGRLKFPREAESQGADQGTLDLLRQGLGQVVGDAGLAVGSGHAQDSQLRTGVPEEASRQPAGLMPQIGDRDDRQSQADAQGRQGGGIPTAVGFGDDGAGPPGTGLGGELEPMPLAALTGQEEPARLDAPAVQGQAGDGRIRGIRGTGRFRPGGRGHPIGQQFPQSPNRTPGEGQPPRHRVASALAISIFTSG